MEGSEAFAAAAIAAGCRFYAGYPMTPATELLESMAKLLPQYDGVCVNAESELEAVGMTWGAAAAGARAATGSTGQGLSLMQESIAEMCHARLPVVILNMARGQGDYYQATRGGSHGDNRLISLAPSSLPEAVSLVRLAFELAEEWRNPVLVLGDYYLAHMSEAVTIGSQKPLAEIPRRDWAVDGSTSGSGHAKLISPVFDAKNYDPAFRGYGWKLESMADHLTAMETSIEPMAEEYGTQDAELVVVAYSTPARYLTYVIRQLRAEGLPIGIIRPITLWPFPAAAVSRAAEHARGLAVYELNAGQMIDDVRLAVLGRSPVFAIGGPSYDGDGFGIAPDLNTDVLATRLRDALDKVRKL